MELGEICEVQRQASGFREAIEAMSGTRLGPCYQCLTCTLGCPLAFAMDLRPHQVVRMVQLGLKERVLSSSAIWLCAACESCTTRCPHEVQIVRAMDALRQMALQEGVQVKERSLVLVHRTFLEGIRRWGRQYELGLLLKLKWRMRDLFSDIGLGLKFLIRGKLKLLPRRSGGALRMSALWEKAAGGKG